MDRRTDGPVIVCLVGGGQEIHDGEGGLREWGTALLARPHWRVLAPPQVRESRDLRQKLPQAVVIEERRELHLSTGLRAVHAERAADWVAAVLADDVAAARAIAAAAPPPFVLTRSLEAMRAALRHACARGTRRCGLVASGKAARLRAEGLGVELLHQTPELVAHWFLDRFPGDIRASNALETTASEFAIQGLELDEVGLAWDGDLVRDGAGWLARSFSGTRWTRTADPERRSNRLNAYRVLLTRARHRTIIWVPQGDVADSTRDPSLLDGIAAFLQACGVRPLVASPEPEHPCALPCLP